jgi:hypothetical protein
MLSKKRPMYEKSSLRERISSTFVPNFIGGHGKSKGKGKVVPVFN